MCGDLKLVFAHTAERQSVAQARERALSMNEISARCVPSLAATRFLRVCYYAAMLRVPCPEPALRERCFNDAPSRVRAFVRMLSAGNLYWHLHTFVRQTRVLCARAREPHIDLSVTAWLCASRRNRAVRSRRLLSRSTSGQSGPIISVLIFAF